MTKTLPDSPSQPEPSPEAGAPASPADTGGTRGSRGAVAGGTALASRGGATLVPRGGALPAKLALAIILIVMGVLSVGIAYDYRSERRIHFDEQRRKLMDRASGLAIAFHLINDRQEFVRFVHELGRRSEDPKELNRYVLVLSPKGEIVAEQAAVESPALRERLISENWRDSQIPGHEIAQARLSTADGYTFITAEYMDRVQSMLHEEVLSRLITSAIVAISIVVVVYLMMSLYVLSPLARIRQAAKSWSRREFGQHVKASGSREIQALSEDLNSMADLLKAYEQRRDEEIEQARQIQANLMPTALPAVSGLALTTAYSPAEIVAGDLFDVFPVNEDVTAVAILDVSGHGISAAMLTGIVKMALHHHLSQERSIVAAMEAVNADLLSCVVSGQFVTLCLGLWDRRQRTWTYVSAGHPGGVLQSAQGCELLGATGPLLGVLDEPIWHSSVLTLRPGDRLFLFTDGVFEAGKPEGGLEEEGLRQLLFSLRDLSMPQQVHRVMDEVRRQSGPQAQDDSTIVALEVLEGRQADFSPHMGA